MRPFGDWVSAQANSIEDKSEFIKPVQGVVNKPLTSLQIRMAFADLSVPAVATEEDVLAWLRCFTHKAFYDINSVLCEFCNDEWLDSFEQAALSNTLLAWRRDLRILINSGAIL